MSVDESIATIYMVLGSLASLNSLAALYPILLQKKGLKPFNIFLLVAFIASAVGFFFFAYYPYLWIRSNKAMLEGEKVAGAIINITNCVQMAVFVAFIYMRSMPILKLSPSPQRLRTLNYLVGITVVLFVVGGVVRSLGRLKFEELSKTGALIYLISGVSLIILNTVYLTSYYSHRDTIKLSKVLNCIKQYSQVSIVFTLIVMLAYISTFVDGMHPLVYQIATLVVETCKWLALSTLFAMKMHISRIQMVVQRDQEYSNKSGSSMPFTTNASTKQLTSAGPK
jgi:hypothetical protein